MSKADSWQTVHSRDICALLFRIAVFEASLHKPDKFHKIGIANQTSGAAVKACGRIKNLVPRVEGTLSGRGSIIEAAQCGDATLILCISHEYPHQNELCSTTSRTSYVTQAHLCNIFLQTSWLICVPSSLTLTTRKLYEVIFAGTKARWRRRFHHGERPTSVLNHARQECSVSA